MNILIISHFFPPHKGGVETAAYNKAKQFDKMGHNVVVITSKLAEDNRSYFKFGRNIIVYRFKSFYFPKIKEISHLANLGIMPMVLYKIFKIIKRHKIQIIHTESHFFPISLIIYLYNVFFFKLPFFLFIQGRLDEGFWRKIEHIFDLIITKNLKKVNYFICVSESLRRRLINYVPRKKLITIPNGVDVNIFKHQASANYFDKFLSDKSYKKVLYVGRLDEQKGISYLLKAIALVIKEFNKVHFFIIGNGQQEKKLKKLAVELKITEYVSFLEMVPWKMMPLIYSSADIFCLPSIHEGFPLSIAEALSIGLIIVASATEGIPEAIKENINGFLFTPKNIIQLKNKLLKALTLNKKEIIQISENNRKIAKKKYSWEKISSRIIKLYQEELNKRYLI
ncbi:MAG: glycosyltransferase family 4 protein [Candidatus Helarchaeota archaeon]